MFFRESSPQNEIVKVGTQDLSWLMDSASRKYVYRNFVINGSTNVKEAVLFS